MKNRLLLINISIVMLVGLFTGCFVDPDDDTDKIPLEYLCVADGDIEGCDVKENLLCEARDKEKLEESIGASAQRYINYGVEKYLYQEMSWGDDDAQVYVMDFDNKENSKLMYEYWREEIAPYDTIDGFTKDAAVFDSESGLYTFYSRIDRFYIEVLVFSQSGEDLVANEIKDLIEFYLASMQEYMQTL